MVGSTAQLVALACHYNALARGLSSSRFATNSTAAFCECIRFFRRPRVPLISQRKWAIAAQTPDEWLELEARLKRRALVEYRETNDPLISDRLSAGLVGGGVHWQISIIHKGRMDSWEAKWEIGDRQAADRRIWRVSYTLTARNARATPITVPAVEDLKARLKQTLTEILALCEEHSLHGFAGSFRKAADCLESGDPFAVVHHKDLAPEGLLSLPAKQLLAASQAAWVFGGMGSWNDLDFRSRDQDRYERLSSEMFQLLNAAISASANSTAGLD